ncbi:MAG: glycosyltransferase family 4 protein, partial [Pacificimonas sp.]
LGLTVVMTHHGADYDRAKWGAVAKAMLRLGERLGIRSAARTIAVSPSLRDTLAARYDADERLRYIPNGAPAMLSDPAERARVLADLDIEAGKFILTVGRLVPEKAFDLLVDAWEKSGTDRPLVIVGDTDHASPFAKALTARAGPKLRFVGRQPREIVAHLYAACDLFVLPSRHEGLPIVALEAGRVGANMLMSDIPANLDVGLPRENYVPVGDVGALAAALTKPGSAYPVDAAALSARFDWDRIAEMTGEVYREALAMTD